MRYRNALILSLLFLLIVGLRLFVAFQTDDVAYDAYFVLRNVESIKSSGLPLFVDDLSFSGRQNVFSPLYYYVLALFSFVFPDILVLKIIPNLFAASLIFVVFLFSKHLSKHDTASLISAGSAGFIPVFFSNTINNASIYSFVIPLFFLSLYFFLKTVSDSKNLWKLISCLIALSLAHASSLIFVFGLLLYVVLLKVQGFKKSFKELELLLFSLFLVIWANLIIYKRAILVHGSSVIYQNIPVQLILDVFKELTFVESLYWIGTIPLLFGVITIYDSVFYSRKKSSSSLIGVCIAFFLLLWFKLVNIYVGLMFLGVSMSILSSGTIAKTLIFSDNLKFRLASFLANFLIVFLVFASFIPALSYSYNEALFVPSSDDKSAFYWLNNNTDSSSVVLAFPEESSALSYYSHRKNVLDGTFLLINNIDARFKESRNIYSDRFLIPALTKLNYYNVDYILLSDFARHEYNVSSLFYYDDDCVERVYGYPDEVQIFKVNCFIALQE